LIYGARVRQARELRALTQEELARAALISQPAVAQIEADRIQPQPDVLAAVARKTGFPVGFFEQEPRDDFPLGSLLFRARRSMTQRQRTIVHRCGEILFEAANRMRARLEVGPVKLPRLSGSLLVRDLDHAAELVRTALGLSPDAPIKNLLRSAERAGVLIVPLPISASKFDAYSLWTGEGIPVISLFENVPGDRQRFSVSHEIGHLVLHEMPESNVETEADAFARRLLLPEEPMRAEMAPPVTLSTLAPLKPRWGVSMQVLTYRARDLGLISERQQRYLFQQMNQRGWLQHEPPNLNVPRERPRALQKMAEVLFGDPVDLEKMIDEIFIPDDLAHVVSPPPVVEGNVVPLRKPARLG
jgi:Zn-dependent peptidase ImmA (M78 family)/transcriptional regulator with XRE-family HTH domain